MNMEEDKLTLFFITEITPQYVAISHTWVNIEFLQESEDQLAEHSAVKFFGFVPGKALIWSVTTSERHLKDVSQTADI